MQPESGLRIEVPIAYRDRLASRLHCEVLTARDRASAIGILPDLDTSRAQQLVADIPAQLVVLGKRPSGMPPTPSDITYFSVNCE